MDSYITLSYKQRLLGFGCCLGAGALIVLLSYLSIYTSNLRMFVVLLSLGNLIVIMSTMFLMGPVNQMKRMFDPIRIIATLVFLAAIALTIYFGYFRRNLVLALVFGVIEILAFIWYSLSYIPYARTMVLKCIGLG